MVLYSFDQERHNLVSTKPGTVQNYHYVGGSSKLWGATLPRFREADFGAVEHVDGTSPAWPVSYDDLERHYGTAEHLYGVHGNRGEDPTDPWRSTDFPYPGVPYEHVIASFAGSAKAQGLHPFQSPQAIDLREGGRCVRCSTCDAFPCMVDAKGEADVSAMRPALESPCVRLMINTWVERVDTDPSGKRVVSLTARQNGRPVTVRADRFVLSAGAVHTAALLLRSASAAHPDGLANGSDQVGRNYMCHVTSFFLAVDPLHKNDEVYHKTMAINDWYAAGPDNRYPLGNVQGLGKVRGVAVKAARSWVPLPVLDAVTQRTVDLFLQTEDLPLPDNRVTVDPTTGGISLHREVSNQSEHTELVRRMKKVAHRAGYPKVLVQQLGSEATSHQSGTARMGEDPTTSVVDRHCKTHEVDNLWLVDSSPFVSSAAVNPGITIAALALWTAASGQLTA